MCLSLPNNCEYIKKPLIAEDDIICYKILTFDLKSLHYSYPYNIGELVTIDDFPAIAIDQITAFALHSYDPSDILRITKNKDENAGFVVECVIPKGAKYYTGTHDFYRKYAGYASNQIILKKIIGVLNEKYKELTVISWHTICKSKINYYHTDRYKFDNCFTMQEYIDYLNNKEYT